MIERRKSGIQGWGVFTTQPINKNKRIVTYDGEKIPNKESDKREARYLKKGRIWCFKLNRLYVRDAAVGGNVARFINHSCKPNCWVDVVDKTIWIRAARNIKPGEELTYDYNTEGDKTIPCRCRPGCKTKL
jgi:SET domain-containing protein